MKRRICVGGAVLCLGMMLVAASAAEQAIKLYVPYSKLADLSDDQKKQISGIEADYRDRIKQLEEEKDSKIVVLLSDSQKVALGKLGAADKSKRKAYNDKKKEMKAAEKTKEQAGK